MLLEPEFLAAVEADVHLIADLIALRAAMPDKTKDTARQVVAKVVKEVIEKLESRTVEAGRGALNKQRRTSRPRFSDIDWPRTIRAGTCSTGRPSIGRSFRNAWSATAAMPGTRIWRT
jgi:hypothetical protein